MRVINESHSNHLQLKNLDHSIEELTSLFYQSKFSQIVEFNDQFITSAYEYMKIKLLKSRALFELNRYDEAITIVNDILGLKNPDSNPNFIFVKASLNYFLRDYDRAISEFKTALELNQDSIGRFKALIGLGNLAYSQKRIEDAKEYLCELKKIDISEEIDLHISLQHFEANILMELNSNLIRANEILKASYRMALKEGWSYFCQRTLYLMAKLNLAESKIGEAIGILKVLDMELQFSDSRFLAKLVNLEFEKINFKASNNIILEKNQKKVIIGSDDKFVVELNRWPILFKFIELLHQSSDYVSKEQIAANLWTDQKYKPRTHDPRIYDLVKRVKKQFELIEHNPLGVEVYSGGYRLNFS